GSLPNKSNRQSRNLPQKGSTFVDKLKSFVVTSPYMEIVSCDYDDTVINIYNFIRRNTINPSDIKIEEYWPLFQFTGHMTVIMYKDDPIVKIYNANGFCIPYIKTREGYMYVSYQYCLMMLLINKFRSH